MSCPSVTYLLEAATEQLTVLRGQENSKLNKLIHNRQNLYKSKAICMPVPIWDMLKEITSY
jgi:hypothetical protein